MPNIIVHIPKGSFPGEAQSALVRRINDAAAQAEQIPPDPGKRMLFWVLVEEVGHAAWTCGADDVSAQLVPCVAFVYLPAGVLDKASRAVYVQALHEAFKESLPSHDKRQLATSVVLNEVADGHWGVNGSVWNLPKFAKTAGFVHLQHLVSE